MLGMSCRRTNKVISLDCSKPISPYHGRTNKQYSECSPSRRSLQKRQTTPQLPPSSLRMCLPIQLIICTSSSAMSPPRSTSPSGPSSNTPHSSRGPCLHAVVTIIANFRAVYLTLVWQRSEVQMRLKHKRALRALTAKPAIAVAVSKPKCTIVWTARGWMQCGLADFEAHLCNHVPLLPV